MRNLQNPVSRRIRRVNAAVDLQHKIALVRIASLDADATGNQRKQYKGATPEIAEKLLHRPMTFDGGGGVPNNICDGYFFELSVISLKFSEIERRFCTVAWISYCWPAIRRLSRC